MNTTSRTRLAALALLAGTALVPAARAAIDISNSATYYAAENWYAIRNGGTPRFEESDLGLKITTLKADAYVFAYFSPTHLSVGEYLEVSFSLTLSSPNTLGTLTFGLFNDGGLSQAKLESLLLSNKISSHGINSAGKTDVFGVKPLTGAMNGIYVCPSSVYSRFAGTTASGFMTTNAAATVQSESKLSTAFSSPTSDGAYAVSLKIERTEAPTDSSGTFYDVSVSLGGETSQTVSVSNSQEVFDILGIRSPVSGSGNSIEISNFSVKTTGTVIPEPSAFGLMCGVLSLLVAAFPRRRSRRK